MTEEQTKLERIVHLRTRFMRRKWDKVNIDTSHSTFIEISFERDHPEHSGKRDFRQTRFPSDISKVIEIQQQKLLRDVKDYVGGGEYLDELLEVMVG